MSGIPTTGEMSIIIQMPENSGGELPSEAPSPSTPQDESNKSKDPVNGDKNGQFKLSIAVSTAKNIAMQGVNAAVSNIGLATGNYYLQSKIESGIQAGQTIVGLAASFTNVYTAIAAVAGLGISAASQIYQQKKEREIANYQAEQYAKRLGYTVGRK